MKIKKASIILLFILLLGGGLRLWQLGTIPLSPDWDEVALGYNAHSLFLTGRDEFGASFPPILRSFDDYKPALYAYLAIPSVELFGLNTFAVRLPSAIFGIIAILVLYFLVKEVFSLGKIHQSEKRYSEIVALTAAFLLAISPWHIQFSRIAFETNVGLTCNLLVALFFLKGLRAPWMLFLSALFAGLNISVYQSERVFTPLLVLGLILIFRKNFLTLPKKYVIGSIILGLIFVLPTFFYITNNHNALLRVKGTSIFSNQTELLKRTVDRVQEDKQKHDFFGQIVDNRRVVYSKSVVDAYIAHFDPKWLFLTGDSNRHHAPRMGLLYLFALPFMLIGIYQLSFGRFDSKIKQFVFAWLLLAPIPASITTGVPHAVRTLNSLPMYELVTAIGVIGSYFSIRNYKIKKQGIKIGIYMAFTMLIIVSFVYYCNQYFVQQNYFHAYDWQYGYEKAIPKIQEMKDKYKTIIVSDKQPLDQSYMFFLFYLKYSPQRYQKIGEKSSGGFASIHYFDTYQFRSFDWNKEKENHKALFVGGPNDFPKDIISKVVISYPDGLPAILLVDPKNNR